MKRLTLLLLIICGITDCMNYNYVLASEKRTINTDTKPQESKELNVKFKFMTM
jgi:hypothetical protein